ncbi:unnamed protein product, partial [Cyprideis torosa]
QSRNLPQRGASVFQSPVERASVAVFRLRGASPPVRPGPGRLREAAADDADGAPPPQEPGRQRHQLVGAPQGRHRCPHPLQPPVPPAPGGPVDEDSEARQTGAPSSPAGPPHRPSRGRPRHPPPPAVHPAQV